MLKVKVAIKRRLSSSYWTADHYTCDVRNDLVVIFEVTFIRPVNKNDVVLRSKIAGILHYKNQQQQLRNVTNVHFLQQGR